jgi:hypothetical protein
MATRRKPRAGRDFPTAAMLILQDYEAFLRAGMDDGITKAFAARHAAGRAALAHLEQLLAVAGQAGSAEEATELAASIAEWRTRMPPEAMTEAGQPTEEETGADEQDGGC